MTDQAVDMPHPISAHQLTQSAYIRISESDWNNLFFTDTLWVNIICNSVCNLINFSVGELLFFIYNRCFVGSFFALLLKQINNGFAVVKRKFRFVEVIKLCNWFSFTSSTSQSLDFLRNCSTIFKKLSANERIVSSWINRFCIQNAIQNLFPIQIPWHSVLKWHFLAEWVLILEPDRLF